MCSQLKHSPDYEALIKRQLERENVDELSDRPKSILKKEEKNYELKQDLEDRISSLRNVLSQRDREVHELRKQCSKLEAEIGTLKKEADPGSIAAFKKVIADKERQIEDLKRTKDEDRNEKNCDTSEKRFNEILLEKENLATEVYRLKKELKEGSINSYQEDRLKESENDLEIAQNTIIAARNEIKELQDKLYSVNDCLKTLENEKDDLRKKNNLLKEEVDSIRSENDAFQRKTPIIAHDVNVTSCIKEIDDLRTALKNLRAKNHELVEDNIQLCNTIKDMQRCRFLSSETSNDDLGLTSRYSACSDYDFNDFGVVQRSRSFGTINGDADTKEPKLNGKEKWHSERQIERKIRENLPEYKPMSKRQPDIVTDVLDDVEAAETIENQSSIEHVQEDKAPSTRPASTNNSCISDEWTPPRGKTRKMDYPEFKENSNLRGTNQIQTIDVQMTDDRRRHSRQNSFNSDSTDIILDAAQQVSFQSSLVDTNMAPEQIIEYSPPESPSTLRTTPIPTQHNKHLYKPPTNNLSTFSKRPFAPRSPADIHIDDVVKFTRNGGKISRGLVKFIGHLPGKNDVYLGVELEKEEGRHDGIFQGHRFFNCKPKKGVFVAFSKVILAWGL
ncbi:DgyrCDS1992 [Dimorphilus gyrociliatus]|uniref:DgyrCDS1992 n=1 Tax=Dimorphilus gyrociliatus TaxID=2664684 RepID=A0A7I8VBS0_9ANNE|nr:DgyrCDS1992 [Dimorphilus gyrociliatus]